MEITEIEVTELNATHVGRPIQVQYDNEATVLGVLNELVIEHAGDDSVRVTVHIWVGPVLVSCRVSESDVERILVPKQGRR